MSSYSISFLQDDWWGRGTDFEFCCGFGNSSSPATLSLFLESLIEKYDVVSLWCYNGENKENIDFSNEKMNLVNYVNNVNLCDIIIYITINYNSSGEIFCKLFPPEVVIIGSESDFYFSGESGLDDARYRSIAELVHGAIKVFGEAYAIFGLGSAAQDDVMRKDLKNVAPNVTADASFEDIVQAIKGFCLNVRQDLEAGNRKSSRQTEEYDDVQGVKIDLVPDD